MASRRQRPGTRALDFFDSNGFRDRLAELGGDPQHLAGSRARGRCAALSGGRHPALAGTHGLHRRDPSQPRAGFGPILFAERLEGPDRPTILTYGHGDTVRGLEDQWRAGLSPWTLTEEGDRWYGRGTADNKGQHALNLTALEAVLAERGGKLGFNLKLVLETSEERGSTGLRAFVADTRRPPGGRCADRQRRPARHAGGADDRHRHARHLPFRPGGRPAAGRRALRPLGRPDHRPGGRAEPRARHHHRPAAARSWCATGCRGTACRPRSARCWTAARSAAAARPPASIPTGANRA